MDANHQSDRLLVLDDEPGYRKFLADMLRGEGFQVSEAGDVAQAQEVLRKVRIDLALVDYMLKGGREGIELLQTPVVPLPPVVMISNKAGVREAAQAMKLGAADFLDKSEPDVERILSVIQSQLRMGKLLNDRLEQYPLKGSGPAMTRLREQTARWACSPASVLILGESGTGKEAIARALHFYSPRKFKPFVVVNCPALPEGTVDSELFGHVKGSFTGAHKDTPGAFERAKGGTLYLAEVGELPDWAQSKLLQVLSDGEIRRLGSGQYSAVDVRLVAATNRDPKEALRPDFAARISDVILEAPPLRQRREDIPEIVDCWMERLCAEEKRFRRLTPEAMELLQTADWPGNVRELIRFLRRLIVMGQDSDRIEADEVRHLLGGGCLPGRDPFDPELSYAEAQGCFDRELISRRLKQYEGVKQEAARSLGLGRTTLYEKMRGCGLG